MAWYLRVNLSEKIMFQSLIKSSCGGLASLLLFLLLAGPFAQAASSCDQIFSSPASELVQKIELLNDHQKISADIFKSYEVNDIAKALVSRIHQQELAFNLGLPEVKLDLKKNTDIILFFDRINLASVSENGFLNQHQILKSNSFYTPTLRKRVENTLAGLDLGASPEALQLRPKFAFLNIREPMELADKKDYIERDYGAIGAVLKNEIKERSTWATADTNMIVMRNIGYGARPLEMRKHHGTFEREGFPMTSLDRSYYEAQVFGRLTFSDVEYFLVGNAVDAVHLQTIGKPIYLLRAESIHNRIIYKKGDLLFAGKKKITLDHE